MIFTNFAAANSHKIHLNINKRYKKQYNGKI